MTTIQGLELSASIRSNKYSIDAGQVDNSDGDNRTITGELDPQRQGLLESYSQGNHDIDQPQTSICDPSPSDDNELPSSSSSSSSFTTTNKSLTYLNGLALVVGIQIGSGIFSAPAVVGNHVPSPAAGILVWALAGALVWTGASCFIELGTSVPRNGGMQEYLRAGYGDFAGFVFSCIWLSIVRPCSIAMIAMIFAEHANAIVLPALGLPGGWVADKILALLGVLGITGVNCLGVKTGAKVAIWFLALKLLIISSIVLAGMVVAIRDKGGYLYGGAEDEQPSMRAIKRTEKGNDNSVWGAFGEYATAGFAALWVYGGWEAVGFVAGEMRDPIRDLPRIIKSSIAIAFASFTLMVTALYVVLPMLAIRENNTPVLTFGKSLYGPTGILLYTIAICLSALGSLNANVFAVGRLAVAASQRDYIPRFFAGDNNPVVGIEGEEIWLRAAMQKRWLAWAALCVIRFARATAQLRLEEGVPIYAMLLNALLAAIYIVVGTFRGLLTFIGITEYLIFILTVLALFRLRSYSSLPLTLSSSINSTMIYRTNIVNPIVFCVLSIFLVGRGVVSEPVQGIVLLVVLGVLWVFWRWKEKIVASNRRV